MNHKLNMHKVINDIIIESAKPQLQLLFEGNSVILADERCKVFHTQM